MAILEAATPETIPAVDGWFTFGEGDPCLLGLRCHACGTVVFPPRAVTCPNPGCRGGALDTVELSRNGRVWSYATNHYPPPEPYIAAEPFEPITVLAVELAEEQLVVLGLLDGDPAAVRVGTEVELTTTTLFEDDDGRHVVWAWREVTA